MQITITIADDQLDGLAELIVDRLMGAAPALVDGVPIEGDDGDEPAQLGQAAAGSTRKRASSTRKPATKRKASSSTGKAAPVTESTSPSPAAQTPGYAGAVLDPKTHRAVEPGQTTIAADEPALPAPRPADAPAG